ncbi:MAG: DUF72 domain-containing protein [Desulfobacterota bacterium]|nr:DUF72 domain-containing protein [Thermodesulfobacteriota bacterium]
MIYVGTSGFSFEDWKGVIYPAALNKSVWLEFYERELGFRALEINMTYYRLPSPTVFARMSQRTSPTFQFVVKAYKDMTHGLRDPVTGKLRDVKAVFERFIACLAPLHGDGKLAGVLMQFPYSVKPSPEYIDYLRWARDLLAPSELVVEFRNSAWARTEIMLLLRRLSIGYCAVDEPPLKGLMPFMPVCTSSIGYIRFHGRNTAWFHASASERYNYCYSEEELRTFCAPIRTMAANAQQVFVFFNNCHAGHAARNALQLSRLLSADE